MLSTDRPYLVIAGPGAGKTTGLVDIFLEEISSLPAHKYIAVITYTNASADDITHALQKKSVLGKNIFVGTIHSFINQFIVIPFAHHAGDTPMDISFIDEIPGLKRDNRPAHYAKLDALASKGLITHDQSIRLARAILNNEASIVNHIAGRLHAVLVDEYQDVTVPQEAIFDKLVKTKMAKFYFVGDPEQFVYKFMPDSPRKQTTLPIVKRSLLSARSVTIERKTENHRSTGSIVTFLNHVGSHTQTAQGNDEGSSVLFIVDTDLDVAYEKFRERQKSLGFTGTKSFVLGEGFKNSSASCLSEIENISASNNERTKILSDSETLVGSLLQKSKSQILEDYKIDRLLYRQKVFVVLRLIIEQGMESKDAIITYLSEVFETEQQELLSAWDNVKAAFEKLVDSTSRQRDHGVAGTYKSTIRKSKGLEAQCVLVVAQTENELNKWIETDQAVRDSDTSDQSQMGYVAFSRARKLLVITCTKVISVQTLSKLRSLNVEII